MSWEQPKIICLMRIKNEEKWIAAVLRRASGAADEILILDDGSTDQTPDIYKTFSNVQYRYYDRPSDENRDRQELLNWAIEREADWVLWLNGDEVLEECAGGTMRREISNIDPRNPQYTYFYLNFLYFWNDPDYYRYDSNYKSIWQPRLMTTWGQEKDLLCIGPTAHRDGEFHFGVMPYNLKGMGKAIDVRVKYYGYLNPEMRERKSQGEHLISEEGMVLARWNERSDDQVSDSIFIKPSHYFSASRPEVAEMVPESAMRILDIGCGYGNLGALLKEKKPGRVVVGVEMDAMAANIAAMSLDDVIMGDINKVNLDFPVGYFDCIIMADVIEHLYNPWTVLDRLAKYLSDDGALVASIPNVRNLQVLTDAVSGGRWRYKTAGILDVGHVRFFTARDIKSMFAEANMVIEAMRGVKDHGFDFPDDKTEIKSGSMILTELNPQLCQEIKTVQFLVRAKRHVHRVERKKLTSIIIVTRNQAGYTRQMLKSLFHATPEPFEIIAVDNGSTDGTLEYLKSYGNIEIIVNTENLGFGKACNQGMAKAKGDYILLLNNDTLVVDGWLSGLISHLERDEKAGIVGPLSNAALRAQTIRYTCENKDQMYKLCRKLRVENCGLARDVEMLSGFCFLIKREVINKIGGFDERFYPGNFEDDDFCLRARLAGYKLLVADDVFVFHFGQRTFLGEKMDYKGTLNDNWVKYKEKWGLPEDFPPQERHTHPLVINRKFDPGLHFEKINGWQKRKTKRYIKCKVLRGDL